MNTYWLCTRTSSFIFLTLWFLGPAPDAVFAQDALRKEKILAEFYPYRQGGPQVEGITPGLTIAASNAQVAAAVLPPEVLKANSDALVSCL